MLKMIGLAVVKSTSRGLTADEKRSPARRTEHGGEAHELAVRPVHDPEVPRAVRGEEGVLVRREHQHLRELPTWAAVTSERAVQRKNRLGYQEKQRLAQVRSTIGI